MRLTLIHTLTQTTSYIYDAGLVGKPSAGKSTFFNAATQPLGPEAMAKMAAHPFTTIEPNFGTAFYSIDEATSS